MNPLEAYCLRCKTQRKIMEPNRVPMANGKIAVKGRCSACGSKMHRIASDQSAAATA